MVIVIAKDSGNPTMAGLDQMACRLACLHIIDNDAGDNRDFCSSYCKKSPGHNQFALYPVIYLLSEKTPGIIAADADNNQN